MQTKIDRNVMAISDLEISAVGKISDKVVVRKVRLAYAKDASGVITDVVEAVKYDCVDPDSYDSFTLKVETARAVITNEEIERSEEAVLISVPVEDVKIRPYAIEFGKAKVSIVAPFVTLVKQ